MRGRTGALLRFPYAIAQLCAVVLQLRSSTPNALSRCYAVVARLRGHALLPEMALLRCSPLSAVEAVVCASA